MKKCEVNGPNAHPLFTLLKEDVELKKIPWNFTKFLVTADGEVI